MERNLVAVNIPNTITIGLMVALFVVGAGAVSYGVNAALGRNP